MRHQALRLVFVVLSALAIVPLRASAQQGDPHGGAGQRPERGGGPMAMDPRAVSGQPRPEPQLPVGTVRVRVLHGQLDKNAAPGTPVTLVALGTQGAPTVRTAPVDGEGRASFEGLDTSGATVYYALMLLAGDRLRSQPIVPGKDSGVAVLLAARKTDASGTPQGPAVDDTLGKDGGEQPVAAGLAQVSIAGPKLKAGQMVEIVQLGPTPVVLARKPLVPAPAGSEGLVVDPVPVKAAEGAIVAARVTAGGKTFYGAPATWRSADGVHLSLYALDNLVVTAQIFSEVDGDALVIHAELAITNVSAGSVDPGKDGLVLPLADGARDAKLDKADGAQLVDGKLVVRRPLPPGGTPFEVSFELPLPDDKDGKLSVNWPMPLGLFASTLAVQRSEDGTFTPPAGRQAEELETDSGAPFWVVKNLSLSPGTALTFSATGLAEAAPAAQVESGGAPMMDPRQMSGRSRPDADIPLGTIRATVLHGQIRVPVAEGTVVKLVGLEAGGKLTVKMARTDKEGRAAFPELDVTGATAYYAYTLVDGDRLESEVMTLDKMGGLALMLSARKLDDKRAPKGNPIDDTLAKGTTPVPAGEVRLTVRGIGLKAGLPIELLGVTPGAEPQVIATAKLIAGGKGELGASFTGVSTPDGTIVVARLQLEGRTHLSKPWMHDTTRGVARELLAVDKLLVTMHMAGELDDEQLRCQVQIVIQNVGGTPFTPPKEGILIPLPAGATQPALDGENPGVVVDADKNIAIKRTLPPGTTNLVAGFGLKVHGGTVDSKLKAPYGLASSTMAFEHVPGARFIPPAGSGVDEVENEGRSFWVVRNLQVRPDGEVAFRLEHLPERPRSERLARGLAGAIVLLLLGLAVYVSFFRKERGGAPQPAATRKSLESERERLYDELVKIERLRAERQRDAPELERQRAELVARLTSVLRQLEELEAGRAPA